MKIKWTIITLLSLTAIAAASYWGVDVFNDNKTYQRNMQSAREAVAAHEWSDAAVYYKAARKVHVQLKTAPRLSNSIILIALIKKFRPTTGHLPSTYTVAF